MKLKFAKTIIGLFVVVSISLLFQDCYAFRGKNKCDTCPGLVKGKKVRRPSKGSL